LSSLQLSLAGTDPTGGSNALLDNFSFGASSGGDLSAAPEAGTYLLIGTGLIGLGLLRKRMKFSRPVPEL
jgi:threonine dehydrogenase-like Zn-dependent dehydrogenase